MSRAKPGMFRAGPGGDRAFTDEVGDEAIEDIAARLFSDDEATTLKNMFRRFLNHVSYQFWNLISKSRGWLGLYLEEVPQKPEEVPQKPEESIGTGRE